MHLSYFLAVTVTVLTIVSSMRFRHEKAGRRQLDDYGPLPGSTTAGRLFEAAQSATIKTKTSLETATIKTKTSKSIERPKYTSSSQVAPGTKGYSLTEDASILSKPTYPAYMGTNPFGSNPTGTNRRGSCPLGTYYGCTPGATGTRTGTGGSSPISTGAPLYPNFTSALTSLSSPVGTSPPQGPRPVSLPSGLPSEASVTVSETLVSIGIPFLPTSATSGTPVQITDLPLMPPVSEVASAATENASLPPSGGLSTEMNPGGPIEGASMGGVPLASLTNVLSGGPGKTGTMAIPEDSTSPGGPGPINPTNCPAAVAVTESMTMTVTITVGGSPPPLSSVAPISAPFFVPNNGTLSGFPTGRTDTVAFVTSTGVKGIPILPVGSVSIIQGSDLLPTLTATLDAYSRKRLRS